MNKVLLVDDEELERIYLKTFLEKQCVGYVVVGEADNGRVAIETYQRTKPDIIFMDIKMPGIDGLMATHKIKEFNHKVKIIVLSAYEDFHLVQQALRLGADDYLVKPAQPDEILTALNQVRQKSQNGLLDFYVSDLRDDSIFSYYPFDKEKFIIMALQKNDLKLLKATFNEFTNRLQRSTIETSTFKIRLFELIIILSRTLVELGFNETEIDQFKLNNFQTVSGIQTFTEVQPFIGSLHDQLIDITSINTNGKELVSKILSYIHANIANDLSLKYISIQFHFSSCHLSRLLKKETGLTYPEFINQIRLTEAKKLLRNSNLKISKIAQEVGYQEVSHFNRLFKKTEGLNPSKYRETLMV